MQWERLRRFRAWVHKKRETVIAVVLSLLLTYSYYVLSDEILRREYWATRLVYLENGGPHPYIQNAIEPFSATVAPWSWRVLHPTVAYLLPFDTYTSFLVVTAGSIATTGFVVYLIGHEVGFDTGTALIGTVLYFTLAWATDFLFKGFWIDEPLFFLFMSLGVYAILAERTRLFWCVLALGAFEKVSILLLVPLYYTLTSDELVDKKRLRRTVQFGAVPLAVIMAVRLALPASNDYGLWMQFLEIGVPRLRALSPGDLIVWLIEPFGVLVLLPLLRLDKALPWLVRFSPLIGGTYAQLLFASNEQSLIVGAFPALILMALYGIEHVSKTMSALSGIDVPTVLCVVPFCIIILEQARSETARPMPLELQLTIVLVFIFGVGLAAYTMGQTRISRSH